MSLKRKFWLSMSLCLLLGVLLEWQPTSVLAQSAPDAATATIVSQNITANTVWNKAGSPYQLTSTAFSVEKGATLTIEPGVEIIAANSGHFTVRGTLIAQGTVAEPILFTTANKQPGAWWGLTIGNTLDQPASATLEHVIVEYGNVIDLPHYGAITVAYGQLTLRYSLIRNGGGNGIAAGLSFPIVIEETEFTGNGLGAIRLTQPATTPPVLANLRASGNGQNAVTYFAVKIENAHTWPLTGLPYRVEGGLTVESGGSLTVQPGVEIQVQNGFYVDGLLTALGTPDAPIRFTGWQATPGSWWGLDVSGDLDGPAHATLDHVVIEYGAQANSNFNGNLTLSTAVVTLTNSIVQNGGSYGIADHGGAPGDGHRLTVANTSITGNARAALLTDDESADPILHNLTVTGNGQDAILHRGSVSGQQRWENIGLPYIIENNLSVHDGALTIEPGVEVRMGADANIQLNGTLFAVGTFTQPVVFTGLTTQPGAWGGIQYNGETGGFLVLRYCDIGYGGASGQGMVRIHNSTAFVTHCRIHHSASQGIKVSTSFSQPVIRANRIEANAFGLQNDSRVELDAMDNWWGNANGPTHASNPGGAGDLVSDNVLFDPWLRSPEEANEAGGLVVRLNGPGRFSPGDTEQYQIFYANFTGSPIDNAVLRVALPSQAEYLDSTGGTYWPQREQVFWKLGTLAPGAQGYIAVRVRFAWGLPDGLRATTVAQVSGGNLSAPIFEVTPYLSYQPRTLTARVDLSAAEVQAQRNAQPDLAQLYQQASDEGFAFGSAEAVTYSSGEQASVIVLLRFQPQFSFYELWLVGDKAFGIRVEGSAYTVYRTSGGLRFDLQTYAWSPVSNGQVGVAELIPWEDCLANCIEEKLPGYIIKKKIKALSEISKAVDCVKSAEGDESSYLGCSKKFLGKVLPGYSEGVDLGQCNTDCQACEEAGIGCDDPNCHCCTEDKYRCDNDDSLYGIFGISVIKMRKCDIDEDEGSGRYLAETVIQLCPLCDKCVDNGDHMACVARNAGLLLNAIQQAAAFTTQQQADARISAIAGGDLECDECLRAKDPNELFGPTADLLPGQLVTYTVTYENVGAGEAFDVFVVDELGEPFDLSTVQVYGPGTFSPGARSIFWSVGELAPKGQPGSTGVVSFTVRLKAGLPSGTVISNQAVVHFPSVPEETPTNTVVNVVQPLAGTPQSLQTAAGQPIQFTLAGRDVSDTPLTFQIVEGPSFGTLTGTPGPAGIPLVYTPGANYSGLERIVFSVHNGVATSRPAEVTIEVLPGNDSTPPSILWTTPADGAQVDLNANPPLSSPEGMLYPPIVRVQFSEALDGASVTADTVQVSGANGQAVPVLVRYDGTTDQAMILFKTPLAGQSSYTVRATTGVQDQSGNALAAEHVWTFQTGTGGAAGSAVYLPVIRR